MQILCILLECIIAIYEAKAWTAHLMIAKKNYILFSKSAVKRKSPATIRTEASLSYTLRALMIPRGSKGSFRYCNNNLYDHAKFAGIQPAKKNSRKRFYFSRAKVLPPPFFLIFPMKTGCWNR